MDFCCKTSRDKKRASVWTSGPGSVDFTLNTQNAVCKMSLAVYTVKQSTVD